MILGHRKGDYVFQNSGIEFFFQDGELKTLLEARVKEYEDEVAKLETKLPELRAKSSTAADALLTNNDLSTAPSLQNAVMHAGQVLAMTEHSLRHARSQVTFLSFYAKHLSPGQIRLTQQDVRQLGLIPYEQGTAMVPGYPAALPPRV